MAIHRATATGRPWRRRARGLSFLAGAAMALSLAPAWALAGEPMEEEDSFGAVFPGAPQTWTVPQDVYEATFELGGAAGGEGTRPTTPTRGTGLE